VGVLYANGWGVPQDPQAAVSWLARAAKQGDEESMQTHRELAAKGLPEAAAALRHLRLAL